VTVSVLPGSFRDPSGFLFHRDGVLYRQVNRSFQPKFDEFVESGLCQDLMSSGLLIPHQEMGPDLAATPDAYKVLRPEAIPFVSYPYEWCPSQLRDAALATLSIQRRALEFGMTLRDASAYNIQFRDGKPVFIDTLSFERWTEGTPWNAYRQFCQHFLAPLALMKYRDARAGQLLRVYLDGLPLDLVVKLLPRRAYLHPPLLLHVLMHARSQARYERANPAVSAGAAEGPEGRGRRFSPRAFQGLLDSLESGIRHLRVGDSRSAWSGYYDEAQSYSAEALEHKKALVSGFLSHLGPTTVWDLGANTGLFSRIAAASGALTISFDLDPTVVEANYRSVVKDGATRILPLVVDLTNPSPGIGWENRERLSLLERGPADLAMALAIVHHLAVGNNVPQDRLARFFGHACRWLIVEFVPKSDGQVQTLLASREDVFPGYHQQGFELALESVFDIVQREPIRGSQRVLYLMRRKGDAASSIS